MTKYRPRRHILPALFVVLCTLFFSAQIGCAQICDSLHFTNPSIESPGHPVYPEGWSNCIGTSNVQPGRLGCVTPPTDGLRYLGFHSSDAGGELITQHLSQALLAGNTYSLVFDLGVSAVPGSPAIWGGGGYGDHEGHVEVYLSSEQCGLDLLIGTTSVINSSMGWSTFEMEFYAEEPYEYITFVPYDEVGLWTYFIIDNLRNGYYCDCHEGPQTEVEEEICQGEEYLEGNNVYTETGLYIDHFQSHLGCDSTVVTVLEVKPTYHITKEVKMCLGLTHTEGDSEYTVSGTYVDHYTSIDDCDSTITTVLTAAIELFYDDTLSICEGEQAMLGGEWRTTSGVYSETYTAAAGCDSVVNTYLDIQGPTLTRQQVLMCTNEPVMIGGEWQQEDGYYSETLSSIIGCDSVVQTELRYLEDEDFLPNDTSLCFGDQVYIDLSDFDVEMMFWNHGFTSPFVSVERSGTYWMDLHWGNCHVSDTLRTVFHEPPPPNLDTVICADDPLSINLGYLGGDIYWQDGDQSKEIIVDKSATYHAQIENLCGSFTYQAEVEALFCDCPVFIPNAFSPDGNGLNDSFGVETECLFAKYEFYVFDRNGLIVFSSKDPIQRWNGTVENSSYAVADGEYHWMLNYAAVNADGGLVHELLRGSVNLLR